MAPNVGLEQENSKDFSFIEKRGTEIFFALAKYFTNGSNSLPEIKTELAIKIIN
jgi:hypothetical protein